MFRRGIVRSVIETQTVVEVLHKLKTIIRFLNETVTVQSFRTPKRQLLKIINDTVFVIKTLGSTFQLNVFQGDVFQLGEEAIHVRGIKRIIVKNIDI